MVKVTLYIACYNYEKYVEKSILSAINQQYDDYEILIFDDGSSDNSREVIKKFENEKNVSIFFQENQGLIKTSNNALKKAKGEYIMRLDADDYLDENALLIFTNILDKNPQYGLVYSDYYECDDEGIKNIIRRKKIGEEVELLDLPSHGACTLIRTSILKKLGGYDESVNRQDGYSLWIKFIQEHKPYNINIPLFYYRKHINSITADSTKLLNARREIKNNFVKNNENFNSDDSLIVVPFRDKNIVENMFFEKFGEVTLLDLISENLIEVKENTIITSSDDRILDFFKDRGYNTYKRSKSLEEDGVLVQETLKEILNNLEKKYSYATIYFPTSPFINSENIVESINTIKIFNSDSVISVNEVSDIFFTHNKNGLEPLFNNYSKLKTEREFLFKHTGGILTYKVDCILNKTPTKSVSHIVLTDLESIDIDDEFSFWLIKQIYLNSEIVQKMDKRKITRGY